MGHDVAVCFLVPSKTPSSQSNGVQCLPLSVGNPLWIGNSGNYPSLVRNFNKVCTLFNIATTIDLLLTIKTFKPDIIHTHSLVEFSPLIWSDWFLYSSPIIHTLHDYDALCIKATLYKDGQNCTTRHFSCKSFSHLKRIFAKNVSCFVGVSSHILKKHEELGFFTNPNARRNVIWNPVFNAEINKPFNPEPLTNNAEVRVGFLGRLVEEKGLGLLIDAVSAMRGRKIKVLVGGTGSPESQIFYSSIPNVDVTFLGRVDPSVFFRSIDVLVVPSKWGEPFGLTAAEGFSAGVPVLCSDAGALPEIAAVAGSKYVFEAGNSESLRNVLEQLISDLHCGSCHFDPSRLFELTRPSNVASKYVDVYESLLRQ